MADEMLIDGRAWYKRENIKGKEQSVAYGDRSITYTYENNMLWIPLFKQTVSFKVLYKASEKGIKLTKIVDNGTKSTLPWTDLDITQKLLTCPSTSKVGSKAYGTVIAHFTVLKAGKIGDIEIPAALSYNYKVDFKLVLKKIDKKKKKISVKKEGTVFVDMISFLND